MAGEIAILLLALLSVVLLAVEVAGDLAPADQHFVQTVDVAIACIFLAEWLWRFARAPKKGAFFRKTWWELIASIPITAEMAQALRGLRLLRIVRLMRLLRVIRFAVRVRILLDRAHSLAVDASLIYLATVTSTIVFAGTLSFHYFEFGTNQNVKSLWDSFWWAMVTVTTIGYGDIFPVTVGGRLVAMVMMLTGVGTLGAFTASIAGWAVKRERAKEGDE
ncbi:MAG TPA: ion transporter [Thermoanaerobaculia bacterium]